jgi:8-oxo-dGTP pyrophosphatase MutT (NUDIX family)
MATTSQLTLALLRERLGHTHLPEDPTAVVLPQGIARWPEDLIAHLTNALRPAGVLIPVIERDAGLTVLLTQRAAALKHHAGQVAFPGGGMEAGDRTILDTALRETHEEVGVRPEDVTVLGFLDTLPTVTGFAVTPVVGCIAPGATIDVDPLEVELVFEVPLEFLLDRNNVMSAEREYMGRRVPIIEYRYAEHRIWGATANMLLRLIEKLE